MTSLPPLVTPIKSELDERNYGFFTLPNQLDVLIISDPTADKASASLAVNVGSNSDPVEALGLFHFCEHLLFLGTETYPNEAEYASFISSHGGSNNAYTAAEKTVYYFDIDANELDGALARFAPFFICPLFDESCTDRELNAVNSEHNKNIPQDMWLSYELFRQTMNPEHPASRFHTGNTETLRDTPLKHGTNVRQIVIDSYNKFYSSNMMKLVIFGKESLQELQQYALKHFSAVPNKNASPPTFSTDLLADKGAVLERCPIKPQRRLAVSWALPSVLQQPFINTAPISLLSHCIGDEGPGSLLSLLKAQRLATGLSSGQERSLSCATTFRIDIDLTELGLLRIADILRITYAYINALINTNDAELLRMCKESQLLDEINFRSKEQSPPMSYTSELVEHMYTYEPLHIVQNSNIYYTISLEDIRTFASQLTVDSSSILIISPDVCRDVKILGNDLFDIEKRTNTITYADFKDKYQLNSRISTQELTLTTPIDTTNANTIEKKSLDEINAEFLQKQWGYDHFYKMKFSKYGLSPEMRTYIASGLRSDDLSVAIGNEPSIYAKFVTKDGSIDMALTEDSTVLHSILSLPCPNPYIPHSFDCISANEIATCSLTEIIHKDDDEKKVPLSTYTSSEEIRTYPLSIEATSDSAKTLEYMNSIPNLSYNDTFSTVSPTSLIQHTLDIPQLKAILTQKVAEHLVGFDRQHNNNDLIISRLGGTSDDKAERFCAKDTVSEDVIDAIFGQNVENDCTIPPAFEKPTMQACAESPKPVQDNEQDNDEDGDDEDDGDEDDNDDEKKEESTPKLLQTVETFFDKIDKQDPMLGLQLLPPQLLPIPLPYNSTHFPMTINTKKHNIPLVPTTPPIECWYKFTDYYKTPNVDITAVIAFPKFPSEVYLHLYKGALNDFLAEILYPAQLTNIAYSISFGANLYISVRGHRQGAAQCFLTIISNLFNPLIDAAALSRQIDKVSRNLLSNSTSGALQQAIRHNQGIVYPNGSHFTELIAELTEMTETRLAELTSILHTTPSTLTFCAFGNVSKAYVIRLAQTAAKELKLREIKTSDCPVASSQIILPTGSNIALLENGNPNDDQNAVFNQYLFSGSYKTEIARSNHLISLNKRGVATNIAQNGPQLTDLSTNPSAVWNNMSFYGLIIYNFFFSQLLSDHAFDCLRTKQQLGYIAASQHYFNSSQYGLALYIQSERPPSYLDQRIEYYLKQEVKEYFSTSTPTQPSCLLDDGLYISNLSGSQTTLLSKLDNLSTEAQGFVSGITNKQYDFLRPLILAFLLPHIHRHTLLSFYNYFYRGTRVNPQSNNIGSIHTRRKYAVHIVNKKGNDQTNLDAYQEFIPQNVMNDFNQIMGFKYMNPSV